MSTQNPTSSTLLSSGIALAAAGALAVTSYYMGKAAGSKSEKKLRQLYPKIEPYKTGFLTPEETNSVHSLYYEEVGNPEGKPVLFLHGM